MLHLPADRLAELVDTEPTAQELAHLQSCAACARERRAFLVLREVAAATRDCTVEPLLEWADLRGGLAAEGLLVASLESGSDAQELRGASDRFSAARWSMRIAASIVLLAAGVGLGRATADSDTPQGIALIDGTPARQTDQQGATFATAADAVNALLRAQQEYQRAAAFLLASDTTLGPSTPTMFKHRLAALDELMGVTRSALSRAPQDPVINSYYLAAVGAREATLQQLELALPEGTRIDRF